MRRIPHPAFEQLQKEAHCQKTVQRMRSYCCGIDLILGGILSLLLLGEDGEEGGGGGSRWRVHNHGGFTITGEKEIWRLARR